MSKITVTRHLFLTADKTRVVEAGDVEAAVLWAAPGSEVDADEATRLGYVSYSEVGPAEDESAEKAEVAPTEDKQADPPAEDKAAKPSRQRKGG